MRATQILDMHKIPDASAIFLLHLPMLQLAITGVQVLVFCGLILFDTQRMVRGGIQEPVLLVVGLYLDIINLFMALLEIFGSRE
ncbi:Bax inhibitor-1/YccA family protein [Acidithiobacillus sulfuriphilus]|uniref:Bax inhibitor-1/YccA family protein n=1 Tax=Acidithiobacillus sulfuriphilus TaxID=1867749 RepID=UPI003F5DD25C